MYSFRCPTCSKGLINRSRKDIQYHVLLCLSTARRINYNEDKLTRDRGECVICLEDLLKGQTIARLPCLCIYHKKCIDAWFNVNRSCPEHPAY